jgi:hypothetical protein
MCVFELCRGICPLRASLSNHVMSSSQFDQSTKPSPASVSDTVTGAGLSGEAVMRELGKLFAQNADRNNTFHESINPRHVLLGLSTFFRQIAMTSELDSDELERGGVINSIDFKSGISISHRIN